MWQPLIFALLLAVPAVFGALPNGWKACSRSAPDYDACFIREVMNAATTLLNGDKKLGVMPLEPLHIESVVIPKHDGPVSINVEFTKIQLKGVKDIKINEAKNDWVTVSGTGYVPAIIATGVYKGEGKVLVLPLKGNGNFNITFLDMDLALTIHWKKIEKNGKEYFQMDQFHLDIKPKKILVDLENLFDGNKELGDNMNKFLNENWEAILEELKPPLMSGLDQIFSQIGNRVLSKIPADEIDLP